MEKGWPRGTFNAPPRYSMIGLEDGALSVKQHDYRGGVPIDSAVTMLGMGLPRVTSHQLAMDSGVAPSIRRFPSY